MENQRYTGEREDELYLMHYGVLGMKWGIRKRDRTSSGGGRLAKRRLKKLRKKSVSVAKARTAKGEEFYIAKRKDPRLKKFVHKLKDKPITDSWYNFRDKQGKRIGWGTVDAQGKTLYLDSVAIRGKHQRKGIGTAVLKYTENQARRQGFKRLTMDSVDTKQARGAYEKAGFKRVSRRNLTPEQREDGFIQYAKDISQPKKRRRT